MKPRLLTVLLCALLGMVWVLFATEWAPWLSVVRMAGEAHALPATAVILLLFLTGIVAMLGAGVWLAKRFNYSRPETMAQCFKVMGCVFLVVLLTGASFVAPITGGFTKTVYVSEGGNLTAAKDSAQAGWAVMVGPGTYYNCTNVVKNGVNLVGVGWPTLTYTNEVGDGGYGIIDDRFNGAITSVISGFNFIYSTRDPIVVGDFAANKPTNTLGFLNITNARSRIDFDANRIVYRALGGGSGGFWVVNCTTSYFRCNELLDDTYPAAGWVQIGVDTVEDPVFSQSTGSGIYWESGDCHFDVKENTCVLYAVYATSAMSSGANQMWIEGNRVRGRHYFAGNAGPGNPLFKVWCRYKELIMETNSLGEIGSFAAFSWFGPGKYYIEAEKISSAGALFGVGAGGPEFWVNAQKVEAKDLGSIASGRGWLHFDHLDDNGMTNGLIVTGSTNYIRGGVADLTTTNAFFIRHNGGKTVLQDWYIRSVGSNPPIKLAADGLAYRNGTITTLLGVPCVTADSAQNLRIYGTLQATRNTNNVSVLCGTLQVDTDVQ
jgi:hypothetical protein